MSRKHHEKQLAKSRARKAAARQQVDTRNRTLLVLVAVVVLVAAIVGGNALLTGGDDVDPAADATVPPSATGDATSAAGPCPAPTGAPTADTSLQFDAPPSADDVPARLEAVIETTCGDITVELDGTGTPMAAANFAFLADQDFYVGTPFHRVATDFVIQGGDPTGTGTGGPGYQFDDELDPVTEFESDPGPCAADEGVPCYRYPRGTVAMANSGPDSNGSQFFIVQADPYNVWPATYTPVGRVVDGMDVVDDIANGPVTGPRGDQAVDPAVIVDVTTTDPSTS